MLNIQQLSTRQDDFWQQLDARLAWDSDSDQNVLTVVSDILLQVRQRGDAALLEYTRRFDALDYQDAASLELSPERLQTALAGIPVEQRAALEQAAARVQRYHEHQKTESWQYTEVDGTVLGQQVTPLDSVGLYVPGGKAAYPSSVLMNAIPAKVAGVSELIMVVPTPNGEINELVLAAAAIAGVDRVFTVGGAQAVAALAYGQRRCLRLIRLLVLAISMSQRPSAWSSGL